MFGWFKRPKQDQEKLANAYKIGQQAGQQFSVELERYMTNRFGPVSANYLAILQSNLNKCLAPTDAPPLIVARIEYDIFLENVGKLPDKMTGELSNIFSDWLETFDQLQSREDALQLVQVWIKKFCSELTDIGLQRLLDMAHALKTADAEWRANNPELSAKFAEAN